jgi:hypothetical protein
VEHSSRLSKAGESTPTLDRFAVVESGSIPAFDVGAECSNRSRDPTSDRFAVVVGLGAILHWPPRQVRNRPERDAQHLPKEISGPMYSKPAPKIGRKRTENRPQNGQKIDHKTDRKSTTKRTENRPQNGQKIDHKTQKS